MMYHGPQGAPGRQRGVGGRAQPLIWPIAHPHSVKQHYLPPQCQITGNLTFYDAASGAPSARRFRRHPPGAGSTCRCQMTYISPMPLSAPLT